MLDVAALDFDYGADLRFSLEYVRGGGARRREPLTACAGERFEEAAPVRSFRWAKGAAHFPGLWWSSTTSGHVGFESWLERDLTKKIHASHCAAADLSHAVTCGYARCSDVG